MDKKEYINSLKTTDLRPGAVKIEKKEVILMEDEGSEEKDTNKSHDEIIKWFSENPYPKKDQVIAHAEEVGTDPEEYQEHIYMILSSFLSEGLSKGKDIKPDPKELKMGVEVEYEHTTNPLISKKIAMDHLVEIPDYYTRLKRMEEDAEDYWSLRKDERTEK